MTKNDKKSVLTKKDRREVFSRRLNRVELTIDLIDVTSDSDLSEILIKSVIQEIYFIAHTLNNDLKNEYFVFIFESDYDLSTFDGRWGSVKKIKADYDYLRECFIKGLY